MTICTNCQGEGIVGAGDQPWLKQGTLSTCGNCGGTGSVDGETVAPAPVEPEPAPVASDVNVESGDNSNLSDGSSIGSTDDSVAQ